MKFREERVELLRIRLEKNNFYEDIIFKDEIVLEAVKKYRKSCLHSVPVVVRCSWWKLGLTWPLPICVKTAAFAA